jgi:hypothetical protein
VVRKDEEKDEKFKELKRNEGENENYVHANECFVTNDVIVETI